MLHLVQRHMMVRKLNIGNTQVLGQFIRSTRKKHGLTQMALAQKIGVSRKWVVTIERGNDGAELGRVLLLLNTLGITLTASARQRNTAEDIISITNREKAVGRDFDLNAHIETFRRKPLV